MKRYLVSLLLSILSQSNFAATGLFFNVTTAGNTITITTTIPNHVYPQAGIKLTSDGYNLANQGTECTVNKNGYCIFSVSDTSPATITLNGASGTVNATLCLNGLGPLSCQKYTISTFRSVALYAYVTNAGSTDQVYKCPILTNGLFGSCVDSGAGAIFNAPEHIVLNSAGTLAYITNFNTNNVTKCSVDAMGNLSGCVDAGVGSVFSSPVGITLNKAGTIAYVSNSGNDTVSRCAINSSGAFAGCLGSNNSGVPFAQPWGLAINTTGLRAYVANNFLGSVSVCPIESVGSFGTCVYSGNTGLAFGLPTGIVLNNANTIAYVSNALDGSAHGNFVSLCPILTGGGFGFCRDSGVGAIFSRPEELALNQLGTLSYVPNYTSNTVSVCSIDLSTGRFTSCLDSGNTGLAFERPLTVYLVY